MKTVVSTTYAVAKITTYVVKLNATIYADEGNIITVIFVVHEKYRLLYCSQKNNNK